MEWCREKVICLISLFEERPCLWDKTHKYYRDRDTKNAAMLEISERLGLSCIEVERKLNTLLTQYRREKHVQRKMELAGCAIKKPWFGYGLLRFLETADNRTVISSWPKFDMDCGALALSLNNDPCQILFIHHTPEICEFIGLSEPPRSTTVAPTTTVTSTIATSAATKPTTATTTTVKPTTSAPNPTTPIPIANATDSSWQPHETKSKMVTTAAAVIGGTMIVIVIASIVLLRDPNKRMAVKDFFLRNSPSVLYRRINTREEANLLLTRNHPEIDSDDDLIL